MTALDISVIIPLFDSEAWLAECIDSVLAQSQDVALEILLVDDESIDSSLAIARKYADQHPNITVLTQSHGRQGKARNTGLALAQGEFVSFLDSDDILEPKALSRFLAQARKDDCDFVVGTVQSFNGRSTWVNEGYLAYRRIISNTNLDAFPDFLTDPSSCNKLYRTAFLRANSILFPEDTYCEDVGFVYQAYLLAERISILPEIFHRYRARPQTAGPSGTQTFTEERISQCAKVYTSCLDEYAQRANPGALEVFQGRAVIRFERFLQRMKNKPAANSSMYRYLEDVFRRIEPRVIAEFGGVFAIPFFMIRQGCHAHATALFKRRNNKVAMADFFDVLVREDDPTIAAVFYRHFIVFPRKVRHVRAQRKSLNILRRIATSFRQKTQSIRLSPQRFLRTSVNLARNLIWGGLFLVWRQLAQAFPHRKIWLVGERDGSSAEENGYVFFKYCQTQDKKDRVFFVVNKSYVRAGKPCDQNFVVKGSWRHLVLLGLADHLIFTNNICDVCPRLPKSLMSKFRTVFLTHGLKTYGPGVYMRRIANNFNHILVSSTLEREVVIDQWEINSPSKCLVAGLPRFDLLMVDNPKDEILFCPTWRKPLKNSQTSLFQDSQFFIEIANLLKNPALNDLLRQHGLTLVFRTHFNLESQLRNFDSHLNDHIRLEDHTSPRNLQQAMKEARVLITDYSSIFWDMAYMHKPVILYQFDREDFLAERGLHAFGIDEDQMTFASMARTAGEVVKHLQQLVAGGFTLTKDQQRNVAQFFEYRDDKNCERLYKTLVGQAG